MSLFLQLNFSEESVRKSFSKFGEIKEIRLFAPQNYGFVTYETKDGATKAILEMSFEELDGQMLRCSWGRPAEPNVCLCIAKQSFLMLFNILEQSAESIVPFSLKPSCKFNRWNCTPNVWCTPLELHLSHHLWPEFNAFVAMSINICCLRSFMQSIFL